MQKLFIIPQCAPLLRDYDAFLGDLEEDKTYRQNVNIYVGKLPNDLPLIVWILFET